MEFFDKLWEAREWFVAIFIGFGGWWLKVLDTKYKGRRESAAAKIDEANAAKILADVDSQKKGWLRNDMEFVLKTLREQVQRETDAREALEKRVRDLESKLLLYADEKFQLRKTVENLEEENAELRDEIETLKQKIGDTRDGKENV